MKLSSEEILEQLGAQLLNKNLFESEVSNVSFDSRKIIFGPKSLFFAFTTPKDDGHNYLDEAYEKGVRNFVVSKKVSPLENANYYYVEHTLDALQLLAKKHRQTIKAKVIGITGSYGKTIIKDGLYDVLKSNYAVVKSPNSFNSQIGVSLSVLQIQKHHEIAIIEAGISKPTEMLKLHEIIKPDFGILTSFGKAHDYYFESKSQKLKEKLILFKDCKSIIAPQKLASLIEVEASELLDFIHFSDQKVYPTLSEGIFQQNKSLIKLACETWGFEIDDLDQILKGLGSSEMRLEIEKGKNGNLIINDAYTVDNDSLRLALDFFAQQSGTRKRVLILSEFDLLDEFKPKEYALSSAILNEHYIDEVLIIGQTLFSYIQHRSKCLFHSKDDLLEHLKNKEYSNTAFLIKGSRKNKMESISDFLVSYLHDTCLQINLSALQHNVRSYKSLLKEETEILGIIKAGAYGSGSIEIAQALIQTGIQSLAVAFSEEAIILRQGGITIPIVILNPQSTAQEAWFEYELEPIVYGLDQLKSILSLADELKKTIDVHLNINTGLNRLGIEAREIEEVISGLKNSSLGLKSAFTHLSASEDPSEDAFTHQQIEKFLDMYQTLEMHGLGCKKHVLNTTGIPRFPEYQFDMVRLGLGLYGIHPGPKKPDLQKVHALKTKVIQIKELDSEASISYNRRFKTTQKTRIATLPIGYADGLPRLAGINKFEVLIQNTKAPIVGNVCMDLTMINIDHVQNVNIGDEVVVFNEELEIEDLAKACNSIPYEILCNISPRVKRVLLRE